MNNLTIYNIFYLEFFGTLAQLFGVVPYLTLKLMKIFSALRNGHTRYIRFEI
jgi:hypothetical protein